MRFAGVHRAFVLGAAVDASNEALGVWLRLQSYATSDEVESPRLVGASGWGERRWLVACQLGAADVALAVSAGLARWEGDDLLVEGFDEAGLASVTSARANGKKGGRPPKNPAVNPPDNPRDIPADSRPVNPSETHRVTDGQTQAEPTDKPAGKPAPNPSETPLRSLPLRSLPGGDPERADAIPPAAVAAPDRASNETAKQEAPLRPTVAQQAAAVAAPGSIAHGAATLAAFRALPVEDPRQPRTSERLLSFFALRWEAHHREGNRGPKWPKGRFDDRDAANLADHLNADADPEAAWRQVVVAVETYLRIDKPFYSGHPFKTFVDELASLVTGDAAGLDRLRRTKPEWDAADRKHRAAAAGTREGEPTPLSALAPPAPWTPEQIAEAERLRKPKPATTGERP